MFDFECGRCSKVFEDLVKPDQHTTECPWCGDPSARRLITGTRIDPRLGLDPAFATVGDRWARIREQRRRIEEAKARDHGPG